MWLWWVISLLILISCIIFAWRMIVSSYEFLPVDKFFFVKFNRKKPDPFAERIRAKSYRSLKESTLPAEDNNAFYQSQFKNINDRLKVLEEIISVKREKAYSPVMSHDEEEEDWKEMYYTENEAKEKLENELDNLNQQMSLMKGGLSEKEIEDWKEMYYAENELKIKLENELEITKENLADLQSELKKSSENIVQLSVLKDEYENSRINTNRLEDIIHVLQRRLLSSAERENELENLLISEIIVREKYAMLQSKYARLQGEAADLEQKIMQQSQREMNLEVRLMHLNELESKLGLCEEDRLRLKIQLSPEEK